MKTRLIFIRHAEAEGNYTRVFQGWTDGELTEKGHKQAEKLAQRIKDIDIDVLYSSTLKRATQTAEYIAEVKGLPIIRTDKLKEINGGDWEGERWEILPKRWPDEYETWECKPHIHKMPNGESMEEFQLRLINEVKYIVNNNRGKNVCIVTHGTAIKALQCFFRSCKLEEMLRIPWQDNTSVTIVDFEADKISIKVEGDASHLHEELSTIKNQDWQVEYDKNLKKAVQQGQGREEGETGEKLLKWLFETNAIRVSPPEEPFWYTSGTIGPYYINTHFLYGSEDKATELLKIIDEVKDDILSCPVKLMKLVRENYNTDCIYRGLIDEMCLFIKNKINLDNVDCISGGERRDWFFSLMISELLGKPHLVIYKDMMAVMLDEGKTCKVNDLGGIKTLHVADLVTEASSYVRAWIPAISEKGGSIEWSIAVVDRMQGGKETLRNHGIESFAMINIDKGTFDRAMQLGMINGKQHQMILDYIKKPKESMKKFLKEHPDFLRKAMESDTKTRERARICLDKNIYELDFQQ